MMDPKNALEPAEEGKEAVDPEVSVAIEEPAEIGDPDAQPT